MKQLFGVPIDQFMVTLLVIFGVGVAIAGVIALRNRVIFKMAVRNIPRRRAQTFAQLTRDPERQRGSGRGMGR